MKKTTLFASLLGVGIVFAIPQAAAQAPVPAQQVTDAGVETAVKAAAEKLPEEKKAESASDYLERIVEEKGWETVWDRNKKRILVIQHSGFDVENINAAEFMLKRDQAVRAAILKAKAKIIEFCNTRIKAEDQLHIPGTDVNMAFDKELKQVESTILAQKEALAKLIEKEDKAQAAVLRGTTLAERVDDLMVRIIKKLDKEYKSNARDKKKLDYLNAIKAQVEQGRRDLEDLEKKAVALKGNVTRTQSNFFSSMASMPLYGACGILQSESFDGKEYEFAIAMCWSVALERAAGAIIRGENYSLKPNAKGLTLAQWLKKQDLSELAGPVQFLDKDGIRHFLGVGSRHYVGKRSAREQAEMGAESSARSAAVFSIWGDIESHKQSQTLSRTYKKDETETEKILESNAMKLVQKLALPAVHGLQPVKQAKVTYKFTGQRIFVSVYALSTDAAAAAMKIEAENWKRKMDEVERGNWERGRNQAFKDEVSQAAGNPRSYNQGYKSGRQEAVRTAPKKQNKLIKIAPAAPSAKPKTGVSQGLSDVNDDF